MFLIVFGCEFLEGLLDHLFVFAFDNLEVGLAPRTSAPVFVLEWYVALAAVAILAAFLLQFARLIFEKPWIVSFF